MERHGDEVELSPTEARGAVKHHHVRYVLAISLALVVIAFAIIWGIPAMSG